MKTEMRLGSLVSRGLNFRPDRIILQMVKNVPAMHEFNLWVGKNPLEMEMATHSSILALEIPWTEKPGGYSPWDHKRMRHDLGTNQQQSKYKGKPLTNHISKFLTSAEVYCPGSAVSQDTRQPKMPFKLICTATG